jgi:hypothetical protein
MGPLDGKRECVSTSVSPYDHLWSANWSFRIFFGSKYIKIWWKLSFCQFGTVFDQWDIILFYGPWLNLFWNHWHIRLCVWEDWVERGGGGKKRSERARILNCVKKSVGFLSSLSWPCGERWLYLKLIYKYKNKIRKSLFLCKLVEIRSL